MDGWFPRYSPSGRHLMRGSKTLWVDGQQVAGDGISGAWLTDDIILYRQHSTGLLRRLAAGLDEAFGPIAHQVVASGRGQWATWHEQGTGEAKTPFVFASDSRRWVGYGGGMNPLAMAPDGTLVMGRHKDGVLCIVYPYSTIPVALAEGRSPRCSGRSVVWAYGRGKIAHASLDTRMPRDLTVPGESCYGPVLIDTPEGEWVLTHTESLRLLLFPLATPREGYEVAIGVTRDPDACWTPSGIKVAWSDGSGRPDEALVDLSVPRHGLRPPEPVLADPALEVNTWAYFAGGGPSWVRDGTHLMQQDATPRTVTFTKFGQSAKREHYFRDDANAIWHHEDHSWTAESTDHRWYRLSLNGPWLHARMRVGDVCAAKGTITSYDGERLVRTDPFACEVTLTTAWALYPWGEDVGAVPTICITYDPRPLLSPRRPGNYERFFFALGHGWVRWESWRTPDDLSADRLVQSALFTRRSTELVRACEPSLPWPHTVPPIPLEPSMPTHFPPRDETLLFTSALNDFYRDDFQRPAQEGVYVDMEGLAVWQQEYLRLRVNGLKHGAALVAVLSMLRNSEEWKAKHPGELPNPQ